MKKCIKIFLIAFLICISTAQNLYANTNYKVSFKTHFVPIGIDAKYIEVHTWYPTNARVLLRTIEREGKQFMLAKNAAAIEEDLDLIVISTPPFTTSFDYASLAYGLARKGFAVALITHIGDNRETMTYTMTGWQMLWRALQIKQVIEYLQADNTFKVKPYSISTVSFAETALSPLLLERFELVADDYQNFCLASPTDPFCNFPLNTEMKKILIGITDYAEESATDIANYEKEAERIGQKNLEMQTQWDRITQRALARNEVIPEEPLWLDLPPKPIEADLKKSYIKNYFFIEPLFPFLFAATDEPLRDIEIFNFAPVRLSIPKTEGHSAYLQKLFTKKVNQLSLDKFNHLDIIDRKLGQSTDKSLQSPDLMLHITEAEQRSLIDLLVKNIMENIVNY